MKKGVIILMSMLVAFNFAGCNSTQSDETPATVTGDYNSQSYSEDNTVEPEPETNQGPSGTIDNFTVSIDNAQVTTSRSGKKSLLVTYSFKNGSNKTVKFADVLSAEAYQNDTACPQASMEDQNYDIENMLTELKPGETKRIYEAYVLQDDSDVTIQVCKEGLTAEEEQNYSKMITRTFKVK